MPGKTGKRAKGAKPCKECGQKIVGDFHRNSDGDRHPNCWQQWWDRKNGKGQMELDLSGVISRPLLPVEERRIADGVEAVKLPEPKTDEERKAQVEKLFDGARALQSLDDLGPEANKRIDRAMQWLIAKAKRFESK